MWSNAKLGPHGAFKSSWEALWMHHRCAIYVIIINYYYYYYVATEMMVPIISYLAKWVVFSGNFLSLFINSTHNVYKLHWTVSIKICIFHDNVFTIYWYLQKWTQDNFTGGGRNMIEQLGPFLLTVRTVSLRRVKMRTVRLRRVMKTGSLNQVWETVWRSGVS